ncbi:maoC like domain protein [Mycobacterium xenopi 4042]|uniref:MaoC like domain protein n=1 Tax=Mycobacterium xenopi 4042 TaxID=1299334 RepID=X8E2S2_MYCXE|nr:maoC like domain protein [Mycobacterium xenopi 4042]
MLARGVRGHRLGGHRHRCPSDRGLLSLVHLDHAAHLLAKLPADRAEFTVTATASAAVDTDVGRVVPVSVTVAADDGTVLAKLEERFAIRGRTGRAELADPVRAGGAISDNATDTPRRRRRDVTITAPVDMRPFAAVSGDHNPIHTDRAAALLAGLESPIVHGMWLSAAAQHVVTATDGQARPPARLIGWTARFLGMVRPGDEIDVRVDRVGIDQGAEVVEVAARIGSDLVMSATARLAAPKTVYAFPGQGIQHKGWAWRCGPGRRRPARCGTTRTNSPAKHWASPSCMWCATIRPASSRPVCTTTTPTACCT